MDFPFFTIILPLFIWLTQSLAITVNRYRSNMVLFEKYEKTSRRVLYTNSELSDWKDFKSLMKHAGLGQKAMLCGAGNGGWLAYPGTNYKIGKSGSTVWLIIGETCIPADDVNSAQALGPINKDFDGLVSYKEKYFGSEYTLISNDSSSASGVKSVISPGGRSGKWTLEGEGKKFCVIRPESVISAGICFLPDIPTQLGIQSATIKIGCSDMNLNLTEHSSIFQLDTCFGNFGAYRVLDNYLAVPVLSSVCSGGAKGDQKLGFYKIYDAWKFRMNPDRQDEMNPADIDKERKDDMNPIRMKILNLFFQIFQASCQKLPDQYFNLIRYTFMQHLKSAWEEAPNALQDRNDTKFNWRRAYIFMDSCYQIREEKPIVGTQEETACLEQQDLSGPKFDEEKLALELFLEGDRFDHVIEQVWLMLNLVSPYCASRDNFVDNLWVDFVNLFRRQFLLPLLQQWINPGTWQTYYEYMFNGYHLDKGKRLIISCVQDVISATPKMDPIDRPSAAAKEFLTLRKSRPEVTTKKPDSKKPESENQKNPKGKTKRWTRGVTQPFQSNDNHKRNSNRNFNHVNKSNHGSKHFSNAKHLIKSQNKGSNNAHPHSGSKAGPRASRA